MTDHEPTLGGRLPPIDPQTLSPAHPHHIEAALSASGDWKRRIPHLAILGGCRGRQATSRMQI